MADEHHVAGGRRRVDDGAEVTGQLPRMPLRDAMSDDSSSGPNCVIAGESASAVVEGAVPYR
jgi:hypothetical protein